MSKNAAAKTVRLASLLQGDASRMGSKAVQQGAKAFIRMQNKLKRNTTMSFRTTREHESSPSSFFAQQSSSLAAEKQQLPLSGLNQVRKSFFSKSLVQSSSSNINAVHLPGVFFGRLIRRFGSVPSRRISRPSAAFISVNELCAQNSVQQFAPMNNPYRLHRAGMFLARSCWRTGFNLDLVTSSEGV